MLNAILNSLRVRVRRLDRRWIPDPVERERHDARAMRMLRPPALRDEPPDLGTP